MIRLNFDTALRYKHIFSLIIILSTLSMKQRSETYNHKHCDDLFVLKFYGPINPMGSCRARSVNLATRLLGRLCPLSG